jgi:hypothetical protein
MTHTSDIYKNISHTNMSIFKPWLRHYATNLKVAGSIPDEVNCHVTWRCPNTDYFLPFNYDKQ